ncbi:hypothetical protein [Sphaerotilus uruguayifluvii]|uniref:Uncharacterized protein n=1 Tax=Sphaerotilus uruguayifluvii TaxID=2735897 RepID=A0ABX2G2N6_9BURK|nr:hypothetical protein [Leptothrix sp. C29]NRT56031.1 hypothetical protein [Leptothrix sp. C29]
MFSWIYIANDDKRLALAADGAVIASAMVAFGQWMGSAPQALMIIM